ncbi:DNA-directed primase/polymerase protein isoform X1 [Megalopta genalis]|uniref:DNA-directed primase/polymerase protein isoform X1 n=2 Tax=Megalopta genalis TaxID=115081 RepID=UPI003FD2093E
MISPHKFYNKEIIAKAEMQMVKPYSKPFWVEEHRKMPLHILGPPTFWMEFEKQVDAMVTAFKKSTNTDMLCTFVYQGDNGYRKFVVAHPEVYWWHYEHRPPEKRCSYEVIPENSPCRLYLDLEYSIELNPESYGPVMTNTIIDIIGAYFLKYWGLPCNRYNVLNLDSTTPEKFSRHVIINIKDVAFKDNYHVGRLIKSICNDIVKYVSTDQNQHSILSSFDKTKLEQLFVKTRKGHKLFIDTAVYTKNRHFRLYKSTKWGKQSNMEISNDCKYIPSNLHKDKELCIFIDSLVTFFTSKSDLILLEYSDMCMVEAKRFKPYSPKYLYQETEKYSKYPILDKYIRDKIHPGKIRACKYHDSNKVLVYETTGYRYCENIGRCHKSNNVFLIIDLINKTMYQKCHDEDCTGFKSEPKKLPEEVCFQIGDENDILLSSVEIESV